MDIDSEFTGQSIQRIEENTRRIATCISLLTDQEVWHRPNESSNSIGNLMLHLCGNITQYIISSLGETKDNRNRDLEFSQKGNITKTLLLEKLENTISKAIEVIKKTTREKLIKIHAVQGFQLSGIGIIIHVVEHYSYHTGQISFYTKLLKDQDLGYYANIDLNTKNALE